MKMKLIRQGFGESFTEGSLYIDDKFECYTVEDTDRKLEAGGVKVYGVTAIPRGTYEVVLSMSNRFKKLLPEVLNVPQFVGVRIHTGNSSKNTEGCIIVGSVNTKTDDDWVGASKIAMDALMSKLIAAKNAGEKIELEVV